MILSTAFVCSSLNEVILGYHVCKTAFRSHHCQAVLLNHNLMEWGSLVCATASIAWSWYWRSTIVGHQTKRYVNPGCAFSESANAFWGSTIAANILKHYWEMAFGPLFASWALDKDFAFEYFWKPELFAREGWIPLFVCSKMLTLCFKLIMLNSGLQYCTPEITLTTQASWASGSKTQLYFCIVCYKIAWVCASNCNLCSPEHVRFVPKFTCCLTFAHVQHGLRVSTCTRYVCSHLVHRFWKEPNAVVKTSACLSWPGSPPIG